MNHKLAGINASQGIAIGKAYKFIKEKVIIQRQSIIQEQVPAELDALQNAFASYLAELESRVPGSDEEAAVNAAHIELLSDPYFIDTACGKIASGLVKADWALQETVDEMAAMMESLDDEYLRERAADYRDIGQRVMYALKGIRAKDLSGLTEDVIIISDELTPSDTSTMNKKHVLGFANDLGGKTSHTSIIAQTLGIPALVGMKDVTEQVEDGEYIIIDAFEGFIIKNPDEAILESYRVKLAQLSEEKLRLDQVKGKAAVTQDGRKVDVATNIGNLIDLDAGLEQGADGVGLFRTEFLYMENTHFPTEEEQFVVYKQAAERLEGKPLLIRTLDIGGDKSLPYYAFPKEENPFLGWRALRICFDMPEVFDAQLRAIIRASAFGNVKILLPMIISVEEIQRVQKRVMELKSDLQEEGHDFNPDLEVGIMVETPASVFVADHLIEYCDYFSIGTNDLTQYVLAVDRGNENITNLYNTYHPAVLRAIYQVIQASHKAGKWTGMCGGFAGDSDATYLLLGMGLDEFSAPASKINKVKDIVMNANYEEAKAFAEEVLRQESTEKIEAMIHENPNR